MKQTRVAKILRDTVGMFVRLTPEERREREGALAETDIELIKLELEKKAWMQAHKELKAPIESRRLDLAKQIETGREWRQVEAVEIYDWERGVVEVRSVGTPERDSELVSERPMTADERQQDLFEGAEDDAELAAVPQLATEKKRRPRKRAAEQAAAE